MTDARVAVGLCAGLLLALTAGLPVSGATGASAVPVSVNHTYVGVDADSEHAFRVTVTVAPSSQTGAINNTVLTVRSGDSAFIDPASIATSETAGGDQVITRSRDRPATFRLSRLAPDETVSVTFRVYPEATLPDGETLATVGAETQFEQTRRVVQRELSVAPTLTPARAEFVVQPGPSSLVSGAVGAALAAIIVGLGAYAVRRRSRRSIREALRSAKAQTPNHQAERAIDAALRTAGGDPAGQNIDAGPTDGPGEAGTGRDRTDDSTADGVDLDLGE